MEQYHIVLGILHKQKEVITKLYDDIKGVDLSDHDKRYVFALKAQQLYTASEDLLKTIAGAFENQINDHTRFHTELIAVMHTEIPDRRPAVLSDNSKRLLDKLRAFRHFIRHGYDYELDRDELQLMQNKLQSDFTHLMKDLDAFGKFIKELVA